MDTAPVTMVVTNMPAPAGVGEWEGCVRWGGRGVSIWGGRGVSIRSERGVSACGGEDGVDTAPWHPSDQPEPTKECPNGKTRLPVLGLSDGCIGTKHVGCSIA